MTKNLGGITERELTRRRFLGGAGSAAIIAALAPGVISIGTPASLGLGCASFPTRPVQESDFMKLSEGQHGHEVGIYRDYPQHTYDRYTAPKGTDFSSGRVGTLLAAPTIGHVWDSDVIREGTLIKIETPFGQMIEISCGSKLFGIINDKVTPWTLIAREGMDCSKGYIGSPERANVAHAHMHILDPVFAPKHKKVVIQDDDAHLPYTRQNGITHPLANPNSKRAYGHHIKNSVFTGDYSQIERLVQEQRRRIVDIAERHPESLYAFVIRESAKDPMIRDFPLIMVANNMSENGLLETPALAEEVADLLRWNSNLTGFLFAPYANPNLAAEYRKRQAHLFQDPSRIDPHGEKEKVEVAWDGFKSKHLDKYLNWRNYKSSDWIKVTEDLEEFRRMTPIYAEAAFYLNSGLANARLGNFQKAQNQLLIAEGLCAYKFEPIDPVALKRELFWLYRNLEWVLRSKLDSDRAYTYTRMWNDPVFGSFQK